MNREIQHDSDIDEFAASWGFKDGAEPENGGPRIRSVNDVCSIRHYAARKIEFVLDGRIAVATVTLITGEPGCGKSTLVTGMASAIERGVPFAGLATQRRPVLILDRENPLSVYGERLDRLRISDSANFKIWGGWAEEEAPMPFSPIVLEWVMACEPKPLIVVDSLAGFNDGEENSATETRKFMHGFRRLADLGATVVVLHHSGKADTAKDYRGSSDIKASIDVGFHLANLGDAARLSTLRLRAFKARFSVEPETILKYRDGEFSIDSDAVSDTNANLLRDIVIANPGINTRSLETLAVEKGVRRGRVRSFVESCVAMGDIHLTKGTQGSQLHTWIGSPVEVEI